MSRTKIRREPTGNCDIFSRNFIELIRRITVGRYYKLGMNFIGMTMGRQKATKIIRRVDKVMV